MPSIFLIAYQSSELFSERIDLAVEEVYSISQGEQVKENNSVGQRIIFAINSWQIIKKNPIFGAGTGDFPSEYFKVNKINTPGLKTTTNPHNMYSLVLVQLGIIGLLSMLSIFYYQFRLSLKSPDKFIRDVGFTLPTMFLVLMLSDSYLLGHYTTLMYIFFSAFLYKEFEKN